MPIQTLPSHLVNQIAAGEVVERPASVVKELVENSLDAGARQVDIEIQAGGQKLIRIRDNGGGISRDELGLALSRHATSKISSLEDLEAVVSLGFRGEALPSIASVSRFTIRSRAANGDAAWEVTADAGVTSEPRPVAHPAGTSVEVHDLFYNTPARRRFLRTERTEFGHIEKWLKRLALSRPDVGFTLQHNQRTVLTLPAAKTPEAELERLGRMLGESFAEQAVSIEAERDGIALRGFIALPTFNRSQPDLQYWFVNGRSVNDKTLAHAARHAYRDVLFHGRYPAILTDPVVGEHASALFRDAEAMLDQLIRERWLGARAVLGFFPAAADGDDIIVDTGDDTLRFCHLRQQKAKREDLAQWCLADYVAPESSGLKDYLGAFAVTAGIGIDEHVARFERDHDDYSAILLKALADRLAEAMAEYFHERVRRELWGYAPDEGLTNEQLIAEAYRGIRPAPGYPACPDHTEKGKLWQLLDVERRIDLRLTESFAMFPTAAVSGFYFSHPESRYFSVGKIDRDQVESYAARKGMSVAEAERWLAPNLGYDPGAADAA